MPTYQFPFIRRVRTRTYEGMDEITVDSMVVESWSWLHSALTITSSQAQRVLGTRRTEGIGTAIDCLMRSSKAIELLNRRPSELTERAIETLFACLEDEISTELEGRTAARASLKFRTFVMRSLPLLQTNVIDQRVKFRTRFRWTGGSRGLISDLASHREASQRRAPIGAIGGSTYQDVRASHTKILEADLNAVRAGAMRDLEYFRKVRIEVERLSKLNADAELSNFIRTVSARQRVKDEDAARLRHIVENQPHKLLSVCAQRVAENSHVGCRSPQFFRITDAIKKGFASYQDEYYVRPVHLLSLPFRAGTMELLSAFVLILAYAGWNSSSLCEMSINGIDEDDEGNVEIQGYKGKTDDDTPIFSFSKTNEDLYYAVKLIRWNQSQLKKLGYIEESEEKIWFAWTVKSGPLQHQTISFQDFLAKFSERHKLPNFSFDQIRTQVLALTYAKSGSHELTRHMAGHANLYSLGYYINNLLSIRLASSANLEFAKRLEGSVYFDLSYKANENKGQFSTGDGVGCKDPWNPPSELMLDGEICSGIACHIGEGCENRQLLITRDRIEELVRRQFYLRKNWQRLLADNPEKFKLYTFPTLMFVERLCLLIESGPYSDIINKMKMDVQKELEVGL